ncbi:hypothetical protein SEEGA711_17005 [Salmonella enterica subsp. enterica serovar Gaminara str. ATCC BAA-711]|nr:hypothetical protein SEEGA711_17005 [Salmonella enterica subsp. enterica serovar Gaminara str. ATCC BAA-711]
MTVFGDPDRLMQLLIICWKTVCATPTAAAACIFPPNNAINHYS